VYRLWGANAVWHRCRHGQPAHMRQQACAAEGPPPLLLLGIAQPWGDLQEASPSVLEKAPPVLRAQRQQYRGCSPRSPSS